MLVSSALKQLFVVQAPIRPSFALAAAKLCLFLYSTITFPSFRLLHCVQLDPEVDKQAYIYEAATVECYKWWQYALMVVSGLLALTPLLVTAVLWKWRRSQTSDQLPNSPIRSRYADSTAEPDSLLAALHGLLVEPFKMRYWWWNIMLLGPLLLLAAARALVTSDAVGSFLQVVLVFLAFGMHMLFQPFQVKIVNAIQSVLLGLLFLATLSSLPKDTSRTIAATAADQQSRLLSFSWLRQACVLAPLCWLAVWAITWYWRRRHTARSYQQVVRQQKELGIYHGGSEAPPPTLAAPLLDDEIQDLRAQ